MNADEIAAMISVTDRYNRKYMFEMIDAREKVIRFALDQISEQEIESEELLYEELVAQSR